MALFEIGKMVATPAALKFLAENEINPLQLLARHVGGDFGDLDLEDTRANMEALKWGGRIFSSYKVGADKVWIITEADRSSTCILLPSDY